jgi:hypothetical protein
MVKKWPLGVGLLYNPALPRWLDDHLDRLDYIEVIPDMFWTDAGAGQPTRFQELPSWTSILEPLSRRVAVVAHDIGLSLGSADVFDEEYVRQLATFHRRFGVRWHSDHVSFLQVRGRTGRVHNAGVAVPVCFDYEMLDLFVNRVLRVKESVGLPFLLENSACYVDFPEQDLTEAEFLNALTARTGCGLLLDLHNLYVNCRNRRSDPRLFLDALELDRVIEVHIAGGSEIGGVYTDSHSGACPPEVWTLLDTVVKAAPHLRGITFEFHDSYFPVLGEAGLEHEIGRAREAWEQRLRC